MGNQLRICHEAADAERADIVRRIEHRRKRAHVVQPSVLADPPEFCLPGYDLNLGTCLMQEGRGFESTLPRTDDCYSLPEKLAYFPTLIAVNRLLRRQILEHRGPFLKWANPSR